MDNNWASSYYFKYLPLILLIFSLISSVFSMFSINYNEMLTTSIFQYILYFINVICIMLIIVLNMKFMNKNIIQNIIISIIIYIFLFINMFVTFDFYFIKSNLLQLYSIINLVNIIPIYPVFLISFSIFSNEMIISTIFLFFIMIIYNILFSILFKIIKYKNNYKYIVLSLYYFQNNSLSIIILLTAYLGSWA